MSLENGFIIWLEPQLQPNIGFTLRRILAMYTRSTITPPKVNRFGWYLQHSETQSTLLGFGPGRFWARSAQN